MTKHNMQALSILREFKPRLHPSERLLIASVVFNVVLVLLVGVLAIGIASAWRQVDAKTAATDQSILILQAGPVTNTIVDL